MAQESKRSLPLSGEHVPVLLDEVIHFLKTDTFAHLQQQVTFIDCTLGRAGHAKEFVKRGIHVIGIDTDYETFEFAEKVLKQTCPGTIVQDDRSCFTLIHGNFKDLTRLIKNLDTSHVMGVLIDLGVSTPQLTSETRGLSFANPNALLDMRLDTKSSQVRALDLLNALPEPQLFELFNSVMDYKDSKYLAKSVVEKRKAKMIETVGDFLSIIPNSFQSGKSTHKATLPFMALRMAVNSELENIQESFPQSFDVLQPGGRLAIITFHSGEDAIVKHMMKGYESEGKGIVITKKPVVPTEKEIRDNPKARSAKLRVIEKI